MLPTDMKMKTIIILLTSLLFGFGYSDYSNTWGLKFKDKFLFSDFEYRDYFKDSTNIIRLSDYSNSDTLNYYFFTCPIRYFKNPEITIHFTNQAGQDQLNLEIKSSLYNDFMAAIPITKFSRLKSDSTYLMTMDVKEYTDKSKDERTSKLIFYNAFPIRLKVVK